MVLYIMPDIKSLSVPPKTVDLSVQKSNLLIEVGTNMNLMEQRLTLLAMAQILHDDKSFNYVTFTIPQLSKIFDMDLKGRHKEIEQTVKSLQAKVFMIPVINENGEEGIRRQNVTDYSEYYKGGELIIKLADGLKEYLLDLKKKGHFTQYELERIVKLKSIYSMRLYELLVRDRRLKRRVAYWVQTYDLEGLKEALDVKSKYKDYRAFNQKVLKPAITEINKKTDIQIEYKGLRTGRPITGVEFKMVEQKVSNTEKHFLDKEQYEREKEIETAIKALNKASESERKRYNSILAGESRQREFFSLEVTDQAKKNQAVLKWYRTIDQ